MTSERNQPVNDRPSSNGSLTEKDEAGGFDLAAVRALLDTAPAEVREWLAEHAGHSAGKPSPGADRSDVEDGVDDEQLDALDELGEGEDDDILTRPRRGKAAPTNGVTQKESRRTPRSAKIVAVLALIAGVCFAVWYAGKPAADAGANPSMSSTQMSTEDAKTAIAKLEAKLKKTPNDVDAHLELGVLLFNNNQLDEAKGHWEKVTKLSPKLAAPWYNLGFYYWSKTPQDKKAATAAWEKVIELEPDSEMAQTVQTHLNSSASTPTSTSTPTSSATMPSMSMPVSPDKAELTTDF